jgi:hypothetical protein
LWLYVEAIAAVHTPVEGAFAAARKRRVHVRGFSFASIL